MQTLFTIITGIATTFYAWVYWRDFNYRIRRRQASIAEVVNGNGGYDRFVVPSPAENRGGNCKQIEVLFDNTIEVTMVDGRTRAFSRFVNWQS